jgi:hypothetical protein
MEILASALRHGINVADIRHGIEHALIVEEIGEDPIRFLILGPDLAGNL